MFRVPVIALAAPVAEDSDLFAIMTDDRLLQEHHAPDNIVLLLELWALEDLHRASTFKERFGYVSNDVEGMIQIVDDFIKTHGRHCPVRDRLRSGIQDSECSAASHCVCFLHHPYCHYSIRFTNERWRVIVLSFSQIVPFLPRSGLFRKI